MPGAYAGTYVNIGSMKPDAVLRDLKNSRLSRKEQRKQADLMAKLNQMHLEQRERDQGLEAGIEAMEMAGVVSSMNSNGSREVLVPRRE